MGLFQRLPQATNPKSFYTTGLNKTVLIVGLGNPGQEYKDTRHNVGFECIDSFAKKNDFPLWTNKKDLKCELTQSTINGTRVLLVKPTTFMNSSGEAVMAVVHFYKISASQLLVVHDELDINFGNIRTRIGGSDAGHNGIKSITQNINEDFGRVRIGIGPKKPESIDSADFVLAKFSAEELKQMSALIQEVSAIVSEFIFGDGQLVIDSRNFIV
jgi:PTH1 family peptidyl-tRNA hydrolase